MLIDVSNLDLLCTQLWNHVESSFPKMLKGLIAQQLKHQTLGVAVQQRKSSLEVKHLPVSATAAELRERFARFGALVRCTLAPSNTVRVVNAKTHKVQITSLWV